MAKDINIAGEVWRELIFNGKNKAYGAYVLRRESSRRHMIAYVAIIVFTILVMLFPAFMRLIAPNATQEKMVTVTEFADIKLTAEVKDENKVAAQNVPPPPLLKSTIKFTAPVIKKDDEVSEADEMRTQDELNQSRTQISVADVIGDDDDEGADIADLEGHQLIVNTPDEVFLIVEQEPVFPGNLQKWLSENIKYPEVALEMGVQGRVVAQFVIGRDGTIRDITIIQQVDPLLDKEALRVLNKMPAWVPGKQRGEAVSVRFTLPITFKPSYN